jgi:hypothetical protein
VEALPQRRGVGLRLRIAFGIPHQHADPFHALGLLRLRSQRPSNDSTAEQSDEFAPSHVAHRFLPCERLPAPSGKTHAASLPT